MSVCVGGDKEQFGCVCVGCGDDGDADEDDDVNEDDDYEDDDDGVCALQNLLNLSPDQRKSAIQQTGTTEKVTLTSLKEFSIEYFRSGRLTVCLSACLSDRQPVCHSGLPVCVCLSDRLFPSLDSLRVCLTVRHSMSHCLSVCLSVGVSERLSDIAVRP